MIATNHIIMAIAMEAGVIQGHVIIIHSTASNE